MSDVELSEAAGALKEHFGSRLAASHDEGQELMISVLMERLGIAEVTARKAVEALEQAHSIEYVERPGAIGTIAQATMPFGEALGAENPAGPATSAEVPMQAGFWRL